MPERKRTERGARGNAPGGGFVAAAEQPAPRRPSSEQLWNCHKRYLGFEEPLARWQRLVSFLSRILPASAAGVRQLRELPPGAVDALLSEALGAPDAGQRRANWLFSLAVAAEDCRRFAPVAFQQWLDKVRPAAASAPYAVAPAAFGEVEEALVLFGYRPDGSAFAAGAAEAANAASGPGEALWLARTAWAPLRWDAIAGEGHGAGSALARFVSRCLDRLGCLPDSGEEPLFSLVHRTFSGCLQEARAHLPPALFPELVLVVEGPTEALLLPYFFRCMGTDVDALGVHLVPAGGAKQVVRRFLSLRDTVRLPLVCVLDADAGEEAQILSESLRDVDRLCVLEQGEIEDVFDETSLLELLNEHLRSMKLAAPVKLSDFRPGERRTQALDRLWRARGLGDFDKTGFARTIVASAPRTVNVPADVRQIVRCIGAALGKDLG